MSLSSRPVQPVPPESMELVFFYRCPGCGRRNPLIAPTQPSMTRCESCGEPFPVMPVDERTVHYVKIMLDYNHRRSHADEILKCRQKRSHIQRMQAYRRLVEHKQRIRLAFSYFSGKL